MTTPATTSLSRRSFLGRLAAAAGLAPLVGAALTQSKQLSYIMGIDPGSSDGDHYAEHMARVQGAAIKVPSNRWRTAIHTTPTRAFSHHAYHYEGDWDGAFKLEHGCTNPAYVLADLYERTGAEPDWAVADKGVPASMVGGPMVMDGVRQLLKPRLDWQMLYDWGRWCDELCPDGAMIYANEHHHRYGAIGEGDLRPRFMVDVHTRTPEEMSGALNDLRMRCLSWQSTDPRYRTSWPGIPYPEGGV